ncbi:DUF6531 domain-containing protein [Streptomyces sp. RFCAC02]|uniref:DUF6531 domain-containing protein n=1 Tax=Streptomyces sp. RFCAC02 TaxID=2499143 RepID=UPI00143D731C|nr:DUF6531 domain-containing protein [Streptomyces sp. RFCAC02]
MESDPTPGNPDEVRTLADELQTFADDVGEALGKIRGLAGDSAVQDWSGLSADAFRDEFDGVPENLTKLQDSYDLCAQALQTYWPKLETAQGDADRALERAIAAQADLTAAQNALGDAQDWVSRAGDEADRLEREGEGAQPPDDSEVRAATRDRQAAQQAQESAQGRVDDAQGRLDAARQLAEQAREMREDAAREAARDIDEASDAGIQNRKWWEDAIHWVTENWDTIVDVCKVIVAVLGIVVMIIGGPLAWVVLAAALVVLADTLIKYANGEASLWDVGFALLDCIPGMKGLTTLGGLAKGLRGLASTGLRGISAGLRGLGQSIRGLGRNIRGLVTRTDPIDMATGEMVMSATDVELPGTLPVVIERHHRTTVTTGRCFGPSWASTLDQRLRLEEHGVQLIAEDGMVLHYPRPLPGEPVMPVEGPRWSLTWDGEPGSELSVHQRESRRTLCFRPVPGRPVDELPLTAVHDPDGNRFTISHDAAGDPTDIVHDGGYHIGVTTAGHRVTELRLLSHPDRPVLARYGYDANGDLTEDYGASRTPLRLRYDARHRITGWEDRNGTWYRYVYDDADRCVATEGADGVLDSRMTYDTEAGRTVLTDSLGHTSVFEFDDCYRLVTETDPLGHRTLRTWDRYDRLLGITDPLGRTTRYTYDAEGNPTSVTRPDGERTTLAYDGGRLPVTIVQPGGVRWRHTYDAREHLTSSTDPLGATTTYRYGPLGALREIEDPLGFTRTLAGDSAGRTTATVDALGGTTALTRDEYGRITAMTDALGGTTTMTWTPEGGWPPAPCPMARPTSSPTTPRTTSSNTALPPARSPAARTRTSPSRRPGPCRTAAGWTSATTPNSAWSRSGTRQGSPGPIPTTPPGARWPRRTSTAVRSSTGTTPPGS